MRTEDCRPDARATARRFFLRDDNKYGCAESTYVTLKTVFGLPDPDGSAAAMVLNGGVAYSGGMCGAITGASMALGELAELRLGDHQKAKRFARMVMIQIMKEFRAEYASHQCGDLIDYDISIPSEHDRFIRSGVWRTSCMNQIEFVVERLCELKALDIWDARVREITG